MSKDKDRQSFKLRSGMDKKIVIYVQQTSNKELAIERYVSVFTSVCIPSHRRQSHNALQCLVSYWSRARVSPLRGHSHPAFPIKANNSFIIDKQVLNYVFSELKRCFQAMRKWMMLFFFMVTDVVLN